MKFKTLIILFSLIFITTFNAYSQDAKSKTWTVDIKFWIKYMVEELPKGVCKAGSYFRECFSVTEQECIAAATKSTTMCIDQQKAGFPKIFNQPADGGKHGREVGRCAGGDLEKQLASKRLTKAICNDADYWLKKQQ